MGDFAYSSALSSNSVHVDSHSGQINTGYGGQGSPSLASLFYSQSPSTAGSTSSATDSLVDQCAEEFAAGLQIKSQSSSQPNCNSPGDLSRTANGLESSLEELRRSSSKANGNKASSDDDKLSDTSSLGSGVSNNGNGGSGIGGGSLAAGGLAGANGAANNRQSPSQQHLDSISSSVSSVISNQANPSQNFWSTNCGSEGVVDASSSFMQGVSAAVNNGALLFQNYNTNVNPGFAAAAASNSMAMPPSAQSLAESGCLPQQHPVASSQQRRAITGAHNFPQQSTNARPQSQSSLFKSYSNQAGGGDSWNGPLPTATTWSSVTSPASVSQNSVNPWSSLNMANQQAAQSQSKRPVAVSNMSPISPMKISPPIGQSAASMMISSSKFRRGTSVPMGKPSNVFGNHSREPICSFDSQ